MPTRAGAGVPSEPTIMIITLLVIGAAAALATFAGGRIALKIKDRLHLVLGFSAGAVVGVALFDLLPEAIESGGKFYGPSVVTGVVALGFVFYMFVDRIFSVTAEEGGPGEAEHGQNGQRGHLGAGSLSLHSFLDGVGIGLAFQFSTALGAIVAVAVLVHDFSDGINTVQLSLFGGGKEKQAFGWLVADALAPVVGIVSTFFFHVPEHSFALILALFSGFFLYIGASELVPESHHRHPRVWTSCTTLAGMAVIYFAVHFANF